MIATDEWHKIADLFYADFSFHGDPLEIVKHLLLFLFTFSQEQVFLQNVNKHSNT